jgi:hypothetical protein
MNIATYTILDSSNKSKLQTQWQNRSFAEPLTYYWAANGIFKQSVRQEFMAIVSIAEARTPGLELLEPQFQLNIPTVNKELVLELLKAISLYPDYEQLFWFHFDRSWQLEIPAQSVTASSCRALNPYPKKSPILELHYHARHQAYFSSIDNLEENGCRLYAVIGTNDWNQLEIVLRVGIDGHFLNLNPHCLFQLPKTISAKNDLSTTKFELR